MSFSNKSNRPSSVKKSRNIEKILFFKIMRNVSNPHYNPNQMNFIHNKSNSKKNITLCFNQIIHQNDINEKNFKVRGGNYHPNIQTGNNCQNNNCYPNIKIKNTIPNNINRNNYMKDFNGNGNIARNKIIFNATFQNKQNNMCNMSEQFSNKKLVNPFFNKFNNIHPVKLDNHFQNIEANNNQCQLNNKNNLYNNGINNNNNNLPIINNNRSNNIKDISKNQNKKGNDGVLINYNINGMEIKEPKRETLILLEKAGFIQPEKESETLILLKKGGVLPNNGKNTEDMNIPNESNNRYNMNNFDINEINRQFTNNQIQPKNNVDYNNCLGENKSKSPNFLDIGTNEGVNMILNKQ